jgi:hypothetical protein
MPIEVHFICDKCGAKEIVKQKIFGNETIWPRKHSLVGHLELLCPTCQKAWWKKNVKPGDIIA